MDDKWKNLIRSALDNDFKAIFDDVSDPVGRDQVYTLLMLQLLRQTEEATTALVSRL